MRTHPGNGIGVEIEAIRAMASFAEDQDSEICWYEISDPLVCLE